MNALAKFVSASRPSRGPHEPPLGEFKSYQDSDLDVKFLVALVKEDRGFRNIVCIPDFVLCVDPALNVRHDHKSGCTSPGYANVRAGLLLVNTKGRPRLVAPKNLQAYLNLCHTRFAVLNLGLYPKGFHSEYGHANVLLIDTFEKSIERFEPMTQQNRLLRKTDAVLRIRLQTILPHYEYVGVQHMLDGRSIQDIVDAYSGMCVTFGLIYVLIRLLNPEREARSLYVEVMQTTPETIKKIVLKLNGFVASKLRRYAMGTLTRSRRGRQAAAAPRIRRGKGNGPQTDLFFVSRSPL